MAKILSISGSPRRGGNTELLLEAALQPFVEGGHRVETFHLSARKVAPCIACEKCAADGVCFIDDDMPWLLDRVTRCDAVIVGSPVYNRNLTAQLQTVFNRFHCVIKKRPLRGRIVFGGAIAVGGAPNSQGIVLDTLHNFLLSLGVCCVPGALNGVSVVAREKGEVRTQPKSLQDARVLGENLLTVTNRCAGPET
ncbi:MAG: flavodoxin family protein [Deferrisomatales bacterium]|nr:flavodoxin family protein [Deferrisomatales bacterium]